MKRILVPTDFSAPARNATAYAASLASAFHAKMTMLNAHLEPVPVAEGYPVTVATGFALQEEAENRIRKEIAGIKDKYPVDASGDAVIGNAGDHIAQTAAKVAADLIVMGREAEKRTIFGSTILRTIRKTAVPVLVVPDATPFRPPRQITLAVDFTEMVYAPAISLLQEMVMRFDAVLTVLHIEKAGAEINASEVSRKLQLGVSLSQLTYYYERAENKDVESGILDFVERHPADMLVMIAHHHNFLDRLLTGTHTSEIVFDTRLPLLLLKN